MENSGKIFILLFVRIIPPDMAKFIGEYNAKLEMYSYEEWEKQSEAVKARLNPSFNREHAVLWRAYMSNRAVVEPDEKTGRILIPRHLLNMIGVNKEVVFAGADFKIELWPKESYHVSLISNDDYVSLAEKILS